MRRMGAQLPGSSAVAAACDVVLACAARAPVSEVPRMDDFYPSATPLPIKVGPGIDGARPVAQGTARRRSDEESAARDQDRVAEPRGARLQRTRPIWTSSRSIRCTCPNLPPSDLGNSHTHPKTHADRHNRRPWAGTAARQRYIACARGTFRDGPPLLRLRQGRSGGHEHRGNARGFGRSVIVLACLFTVRPLRAR